MKDETNERRKERKNELANGRMYDSLLDGIN